MTYDVRERALWEEWTAFYYRYSMYQDKFLVEIDCGPIGIPREHRTAILESFDNPQDAIKAMKHYARLNKERFELRKEKY